MLIAVDTEGTGVSPRHGDCTFALTTCDENFDERIWRWPVDPFKRTTDIPPRDRDEIVNYLTGHELIIQNSLFDLRAFARFGVSTYIDSLDWQTPFAANATNADTVLAVPRVHELMMMSHLVDSRGVAVMTGNEYYPSHGLKELALCRLGFSDRDEIELVKATTRARDKARKLPKPWSQGKSHADDSAAVKADYWMVDAFDPKSPLVNEYAGNDPFRTMLLFIVMRQILKDDGRWEMYLDGLADIPIFYEIEEYGLHLRQERLDAEIRRNDEAIVEKLAAIRKLAGDKDFNPASPKQLSPLLFQKMGLKAAYATKTGQVSTAAPVLESLRDYLLAKTMRGDAMLENEKRGLALLMNLIGYVKDDGTEEGQVVPGLRNHEKQNGYLKSYRKLAIDGRVHPNIYLLTNTTRISQSEPNGQNISRKKVDGFSSRGAFGPPPGFIWASVDYSQLEAKIFAVLANDEEMLAAFAEGNDFHGYTADQLRGVWKGIDEKELRRRAKAVNFKTLYGGINSVAPEIAAKFPCARSFMDETIDMVHTQGYVETADGYPLYVPPNEPYKGTDYRVQGTAGRIIRRAARWLRFGRCYEEAKRYGHLNPLVDYKTVFLIEQVHDELVFQIDIRCRTKKKVVNIIRNIMAVMEEAGESMGITTPVDCEIYVDNWSEGISVREYLALKETPCPKNQQSPALKSRSRTSPLPRAKGPATSSSTTKRPARSVAGT